jgi:23S rRNA pseudouridine1911/1915/1917 synthase
LIGPAPVGWREAALNQGWIYRDRVAAGQSGQLLSAWLAARYRHSPVSLWLERLQLGELSLNGQVLWADAVVANGDRIEWRRPPWREPAVPEQWNTIHDNGDLLVINKPSGLPVMPGGGFLVHTLSHQLVLWSREQGEPLAPKPVHRLGRFTSGLLVCARRPESRAWLSRLLRDSTADGAASACRKVYRALTEPLPPDWPLGESREVTVAIGRHPHPLLGEIWCAADPSVATALPSRSCFTLLERRPESCLVEVAIATGRPHQIRIHAAAIGSPLVGDPLYRPGGGASDQSLPGEGGYHLHAHRVQLASPAREPLHLEAPPPPGLRITPSRPPVVGESRFTEA